MRILLVDDSFRLLELVTDALVAAGYGVDAVTTAAELFSAVKTTAYDLLIIDLMLPDLDGADAIQTLRAENYSPPILIVT